MLELRQVTPHDDAFDAWHAVLAAAYGVDREPCWWESLAATRGYFSRTDARTAHVAVAAVDDGEVVGGVELRLPLEDDTETVGVELGVGAVHRGRGVGAALAAEVRRLATVHARTVVQAELYVPADVAWDRWPGARLAQRHGLRSVSAEDRFLLDLPVDPARLDAVEARLPPSGTDRVVTFVGDCPEEHVVELARMQTQMNADVPTGDLTHTPRRVDVDRVRESDRRMAELGWTKLRSVALDADGRGLGYTTILVSAHDPDFVLQDDTLVDRAHRGRRLGARLKAANLRRLAEVRAGDPVGGLVGGRRWLQTHTEQGNAAMQRTNAAFGFRRVDVLHECEGAL